MTFKASVDRLIDEFIPTPMRNDREKRTRARMFLFSHFIGPVVGNVIPAWLFFLDASSPAVILVIACSITFFWLFPVLLKLTARYELLSYISIQNLLFAILFGCFFFGGMSSPFLPWLVTVPLLAFFYLGSTPRSIVAVFSQIAVNGVAFTFAYQLLGEHSHVPVESLQALGILSIVTAAAYVSILAVFYVRISDSQSELEVEVNRHLVTAKKLRAAAAEAERAGAAKADFLARMSHELRTPLNAVIGYSQMLIDDAREAGEEEVLADLDRIHAAGTHLLSIINAVLDLSKIEAGKMQVAAEPCRIQPLVESSVDRHARRYRDNRNTFEVAVCANAPAFTSDTHKLTQILDILVSNAAGFTKQGRVRLSVEWSADMLEVAIADTGPGIDAELLPTLFDDFLKRSDQRASLCAGAGLGLPLANRLCALLGATLAIESMRGIGTRAVVRLPAAARAAAPTSEDFVPLAA